MSLLFERVSCLLLLAIIANRVYTVQSDAQVGQLLFAYNAELRDFNHFGAEVAWNLSTNLDTAEELLSNSIIP